MSATGRAVWRISVPYQSQSSPLVTMHAPPPSLLSVSYRMPSVQVPSVSKPPVFGCMSQMLRQKGVYGAQLLHPKISPNALPQLLPHQLLVLPMAASWFAHAVPTVNRDVSVSSPSATQLPVSSQLVLSVAHTWHMTRVASTHVDCLDYSHQSQLNSVTAVRSLWLFAQTRATFAVHRPALFIVVQSCAAARLSLSASLHVPIVDRLRSWG